MLIFRHPGRRTARGILRPFLRQKQPFVDQRPAAGTNVGEEDPVLAVGHLPEGATILAGDAHRLSTLLGEAAVVHHSNRVGMSEAGPQIPLQLPQHCLVVPLGLGQEPLSDAGRSAVDRLGEVLGVAAFASLREEPAQVIAASLAPLPPAEGRRESGVKLLESGLDPFELVKLQLLAPVANCATRTMVPLKSSL